MPVARLLLYSILGGLRDWEILGGGGVAATGYNIGRNKEMCPKMGGEGLKSPLTPRVLAIRTYLPTLPLSLL